MTELIKPSEVSARKKQHIPDEVILAANALIALNWNGQKSKFTLCALKAEIQNLMRESKIVDSWLDLETIYESAGWAVDFFKPAIDEVFDSYFEFHIRKQD